MLDAVHVAPGVKVFVPSKNNIHAPSQTERMYIVLNVSFIIVVTCCPSRLVEHDEFPFFVSSCKIIYEPIVLCRTCSVTGGILVNENDVHWTIVKGPVEIVFIWIGPVFIKKITA